MHVGQVGESWHLVNAKINKKVSLEDAEKVLEEGVQAYVKYQQQTTAALIEIVREEGEKRHKTNSRHHQKKRKPVPLDLSLGDYCLVAFPKERGKLQFQWSGPYIIKNILSQHVVQVCNMLNGSISKAHVAQVRRFSNSLDFTVESLKEQFAYYADNLSIEQVKAHRVSNEQVEFLIGWEGFTEEADSFIQPHLATH
jgi:hypothetical protein